MKTLFLIPLFFCLFSQAQFFELKPVNIDSIVTAKVAAAVQNIVPKKDTVIYKPAVVPAQINTDSISKALLKTLSDSASAVLKKLNDAQTILQGLSVGIVPDFVELTASDSGKKVYPLPNAAFDFAIVFVNTVPQKMTGRDGKLKDYNVTNGTVNFYTTGNRTLVQAFYFRKQ